MVTPVNLLPDAGSSSVRRLTGMVSGRASTGTPSTSWYRPRPPHSAARYASLTDPPTALAAARRSVSGSSSTWVWVIRLRRRSSGDGSAGGGPSIRRAESAKPKTSATVGPGRVTSWAAVPTARSSHFRPTESVVAGHCLRLSRTRSSPLRSRGTGTGGIGRGSGSRAVS